MAGILAETLAGVDVGEGVAAGSLTLFPLRWKAAAEPSDVAVLEEGIASGEVVVQEVGESGSVPDVFVENRLPKPLFILEGEEIVGAKQNRVFNISILVPAAANLKLPVSCVEQGRWFHKSHRFHTGARASARVQRDLKRSVSFSARQRPDRYVSDQLRVWNNVAEGLAATDSVSASGAMSAAYEKRAADFEEIEKNVKLPGDCAGVVVAEGERVISVELLADPSLWKRHEKRVLRSFLLEAMKADAKKRAERKEAEAFLASVGAMECSKSPSPGSGTQHRGDTEELAASALEADGTVYHLSAIA